MQFIDIFMRDVMYLAHDNHTPLWSENHTIMRSRSFYPATLSQWSGLSYLLSCTFLWCIADLISFEHAACTTSWHCRFFPHLPIIHHRGFFVWGGNVAGSSLRPRHRANIFYMAWYSIKKVWMRAIDFCHLPLLELCCTLPMRSLHPNNISCSVCAKIWGGNQWSSINALHASVVCINKVDWHCWNSGVSSFGVTICQYIASIREHCVLAAMCFIMRWDLSTIPFWNGTWVHRNLIRTLHSLASLVNLSPQNTAASLASSSIGNPAFIKDCF